MRFPILIAILLLSAAIRACGAEPHEVVFNEIYYDPPEKTKAVRFVELYNRSERSDDLSGWKVSGAIQFSFPTGAKIDPHGYAVIAENPETFKKEFTKDGLGPFTGTLGKHGASLTLRDASGVEIDKIEFAGGFPWPTAAAGGGASMEKINPALPSDNPGSWRSSGVQPKFTEGKTTGDRSDKTKIRATPGRPNASYIEETPPIVDQVAHTPLEPRAGQALIVGARVRAEHGIKSVTLEHQIVEPGAYTPRDDEAFERGWQPVSMHDDGKDGDARAGDGIYTAVLPAALSLNRRLIRYRIVAEDNLGAKVRVPYSDDESPDFAAFIYNGEPEWSGSIEPGKAPPLNFPTALMRTLPSLILLANRKDVEESQWNTAAIKKKFRGTLIAEGRVYDNIQFHNRGQGSTYVAGKNKWGFKFNRGRDYDARDMWGRKFAHGWDTLPMTACASPWVQSNRGMAGLDEAVSFRLYELAGVLSPRVRHVQYRIVASAEEAPKDNQFGGDLWGLYLEIEEPNGSFLATRNLPEGNVYRIGGGQGDRKHQARDQPADGSDWNHFRDESAHDQPEQWWRSNLDLPAFYAFHAINCLVGNVDLREGDNHYYYHRPDGHWSVIPWDLDMMFIPMGHQSGRIEQDRCLKIPALRIEYQNRCRELVDLLCSDAAPNGGQAAQLVDELATHVHPREFPLAWPELDECLWDYHPHTSEKGAFYRNPVPGGPDHNFTRTLSTPDFFGFAKFIADYCTDARPKSAWRLNDGDPKGYGFGYLRDEAKDADIPDRPAIAAIGPPQFPINDLRFRCSPYVSPKGAASAAEQWRLGEISAPGIRGYVTGQPRKYEIEEVWSSLATAPFAAEIKLPPEALRPGATYRARVRVKDATGRWSHWSEPAQFAAGQ